MFLEPEQMDLATSISMAPPRLLRTVGLLVLVTGGALAGCDSGTSQQGGGLSSQDADFSVCSGTPAVRFAPGVSVMSTSGAYQVTMQSAVTTQAVGPNLPTAGIGYDTFVMTVTATSAGADGGTPAPDGLMMTTPPASGTYPADPYMPMHMHGASTIPAITAMGGGQYSVANLDFFMGGYWQLYLDLTPSGAAVADPVTFDVCIPND
jgi:hypothetical protein